MLPAIVWSVGIPIWDSGSWMGTGCGNWLRIQRKQLIIKYNINGITKKLALYEKTCKSRKEDFDNGYNDKTSRKVICKSCYAR